MVEFLSSASVDIILLCATVVHLLLAGRVLKSAGKRDSGFTEKFEMWRMDLVQSARERREKSRPSPAE